MENKFMFRNKEVIDGLVAKIKTYDGQQIKLMEVCGTHTMAISKFGIRDILPENIKLYSGPGCPVCVTPSYYIKAAMELSKMDDVIITTFGDMMKVPYEGITLYNMKSQGKDIRIIYAPLDCIQIAKQNPNKKVVFLSVGFETTIPVIAIPVLEAHKQGVNNFFILSANKTLPEALKILSSDKEIAIDGYIYPGHVSSIIGDNIYWSVAKTYGIPGVITGFEPADILASISVLIDNIKNKKAKVVNLYSRVVKPEGNLIALDIMNEVFEPCDTAWRGIGVIPDSGMRLQKKYRSMDAWYLVEAEIQTSGKENPACLCGEILKGKRLPRECPLFGKVCNLENPVGSCMVSSEGTCAAYYRYT
jgi:hydrogenase expression/formation protein HypD